MKLNEIYKKNNLTLSIEVFPPKNDETLIKELLNFKKYNFEFVSLTCGANGKDNKSFDLIEKIKQNFNVMPHFTCITSSFEDVQNGLSLFQQMNVENILALRGDIPDDITLRKYDFKYANELVKYIKEKTDFSIAVAGYPEGHIESPNLDTDIKILKKKVDCGADVIFTQLFFDNSKFYEFKERASKIGIKAQIIPGIMPILNKKQIYKMTSLAKITIPKELQNAIERYDSLIDFGIDFASRQCEDLIRNEVKGLHFFTLNKSYSTTQILDNIRR